LPTAIIIVDENISGRTGVVGYYRGIVPSTTYFDVFKLSLHMSSAIA
jgi:hypothetical protein